MIERHSHAESWCKTKTWEVPFASRRSSLRVFWEKENCKWSNDGKDGTSSRLTFRSHIRTQSTWDQPKAHTLSQRTAQSQRRFFRSVCDDSQFQVRSKSCPDSKCTEERKRTKHIFDRTSIVGCNCLPSHAQQQMPCSYEFNCTSKDFTSSNRTKLFQKPTILSWNRFEMGTFRAQTTHQVHSRKLRPRIFTSDLTITLRSFGCKGLHLIKFASFVPDGSSLASQDQDWVNCVWLTARENLAIFQIKSDPLQASNCARAGSESGKMCLTCQGGSVRVQLRHDVGEHDPHDVDSKSNHAGPYEALGTCPWGRQSGLCCCFQSNFIDEHRRQKHFVSRFQSFKTHWKECGAPPFSSKTVRRAHTTGRRKKPCPFRTLAKCCSVKWLPPSKLVKSETLHEAEYQFNLLHAGKVRQLFKDSKVLRVRVKVEAQMPNHSYTQRICYFFCVVILCHFTCVLQTQVQRRGLPWVVFLFLQHFARWSPA